VWLRKSAGENETKTPSRRANRRSTPARSGAEGTIRITLSFDLAAIHHDHDRARSPFTVVYAPMSQRTTPSTPQAARFRHWNRRRRWMGNVLPAVFWFPLTMAGLIIYYRTGHVWGWAFNTLCLGQFLGLVSLNYLGLFENALLRKELDREFRVLRPRYTGYRVFVGFASQGYSSWVDPHEDVGYLCLTPETIEFYGDQIIWKLEHKDVLRITKGPNIHSLVGLGRWIRIEATLGGSKTILRLEPRDRDTLIGNLIGGRKLRVRLLNWQQAKGAPNQRLGRPGK